MKKGKYLVRLQNLAGKHYRLLYGIISSSIFGRYIDENVAYTSSGQKEKEEKCRIYLYCRILWTVPLGINLRLLLVYLASMSHNSGLLASLTVHMNTCPACSTIYWGINKAKGRGRGKDVTKERKTGKERDVTKGEKEKWGGGRKEIWWIKVKGKRKGTQREENGMEERIVIWKMVRGGKDLGRGKGWGKDGNEYVNRIIFTWRDSKSQRIKVFTRLQTKFLGSRSG